MKGLSALLTLSVVLAAASSDRLPFGSYDRSSGGTPVTPWQSPCSAITINSPESGTLLTGSGILISLRVGRYIDLSTIAVKVNGDQVQPRLAQGPCSLESCSQVFLLTASHGLRRGKNDIHVSAQTFGKLARTAGIAIDYQATGDDKSMFRSSQVSR